MKTITVTISPVGIPTVEAHGFMDGSCKHATKPILDALRDTTKPETVDTVDKMEAGIPAPSNSQNETRMNGGL